MTDGFPSGHSGGPGPKAPLSSAGGSQRSDGSERGESPIATPAGKGFLLDLERCVGCGACVLACRMENHLPESVSWRRILPFNVRRNPRGPTYHFTLACHHCQDPPCARGCPSGALEKGPDGMVLLHEDRCIGCRYCEMACPFGAPAYDQARGVMTKCHFCVQRQEEGRDPACVAACPTLALRFTPGDTGLEDSFQGPEEIPGFMDPGRAGPNLWMAPPREGKRGARYQELKALLREEDSGRPEIPERIEGKGSEDG